MGKLRHVGLRSQNEKVTEAGLEPGPPDPWPITYSKQNLEEWVGIYGDRGRKALGYWRQGAALTVE